jgi:hypothetical protein
MIIGIFYLNRKYTIENNLLIRKGLLFSKIIPISSISQLNLHIISYFGLPDIAGVDAVANGKTYKNIIKTEEKLRPRANSASREIQFNTFYESLDLSKKLLAINPKIKVNDDLRYYLDNHKLPEKYDTLTKVFGYKIGEWG